MMNRVLYIGGFEMPDKNAAAQRVLAISKALRVCGYSVSFYGITKSGDFNGMVDGFEYEALSYPNGAKEWAKYAIGDGIVEYVREKKPSLVLTYNYPAIAQERLVRFCRKSGIKVVGDITEWYMPSDIIRKVDTALRMRWSNKHLDGIISISRFLDDYYKNYNSILVPPLVDKSDNKWAPEGNDTSLDGQIRLCYVGSPGGKDRLDYIAAGIKQCDFAHISLNVIGITKAEYYNLYGYDDELDKLPITFLGRLSHTEAIQQLKTSDFQIFFREDTRVNNAGFPTKFVEAMSAGVPVITNKTSNLSDFLISGENGYLIEDASADSISRVLNQVSHLSKEDVLRMKGAINSSTFDYHNYVVLISTFINNLMDA